MADSYELTKREVLGGVALGTWLLCCDAALRVTARLATCPPSAGVGPDVLDAVMSQPASCTATEMAGPSIQLLASAHDGVVFGLAGGLTPGVVGQLYALGLLALATVATVLVGRWQWHSGADPKALACVWAGAISGALPRLVGDGRAIAELSLFGLHTGIGEIALVWGVAWLLGRFIGELRA